MVRMPSVPQLSPTSTAAERRRAAQSAMRMAKKDKGSKDENSAADDDENKGKRGWFGLGGSKEDDSKDEQGENDGDNAKSSQRKRGFLRRGEKDEDDPNDDTKSSNAKKRRRSVKKKASGGGQDEVDDQDSENSGGFFRRILRSRGSDEDGDTDGKKNNKKNEEDSKKNLSLPSVDINAFVGPRMPDLGSELDVQAELGLSPEEVGRKEKARMAMELAKVKRLEAEERRQAKIKAAAERAEKLAEERRLAEQKKQEILARQKAVREAAKTKSSPATKKAQKDAPELEESEERSSRWPSLPFGGGNKKKDKSSDEDNTSKSKADKKDGEGGGGIGSVFSGMSGIFGGGGSEKEQPGEWIVVCPKTRIAPGIIVPVVVGGLDLLIVVSKDGKRLACISNSCPHLGTPLETGIIERRPVAGAAAQKPDVADDGCEDCIVCPTHNTAFALASGEVRGEWCPYPPVIGSMMGAVKTQQNLPTFEIRARGKNIEVRLASSLDDNKD